MRFLFTLVKFCLALLIWTAIGQIPIKGKSLEQFYHQQVNSDKFQKVFWTVATPITWTKDKIDALIESRKRYSEAR